MLLLDSRDWWILFNVVNCAATGIGVYLSWRRFERARSARRGADSAHSDEDVVAICDRNIAVARENIILNLALLLLGLYMIVVAFGWQGPVPSVIVNGTGLFAPIWVFAALREWRDGRRMDHIAVIQQRLARTRTRARSGAATPHAAIDTPSSTTGGM